MKRWTWLLVAAALGAAEINSEALRNAQQDANNWISTGRTLNGWRHSPLTQINTSNVKRLTPQWVYQTGTLGRFEGTPLVFDNRMYITGPDNHAWALDLLTGRPIWHYYKALPPGVSICCGRVNRGFAALGKKLYKMNLEAKLVALDADTGKTLWETQVDDIKKGISGTVAPIIAKNLVVVGVAGAEFGIRGFIDAYDADTGKRAWRFYTVAGPEDPGSKSWGGDSYQRGGGSIWVAGTYDPESNLVFFGTGNPGPDMNGDPRPGDNLYTCSIVALDADTGKLRWHYQNTPHDVHDWDSISDPVLADVMVNGRKVPAVIQANRNGFFYALERASGKVLVAKAYTKVTWADGIGADGRPILISGQGPSEEGTKACPGIGGGHNWQATTFNPQTGWYYFGTTEGCQIYYNTKMEFREGEWYQASTAQGLPTEPQTGAVVALDPGTGAVKWKFEMLTSPSAGLLSTAGGLVFAGDPQGYVFGLDAKTGKSLWDFFTGGPVAAPPMTYTLNGKQYLTVATGASIMTFALPDEAGRGRGGAGR